MLAKAKVEEACRNLQIKTSLHELAEIEHGWIEQHFFLKSQQLGYKELLGGFAVIDRRIPKLD